MIHQIISYLSIIVFTCIFLLVPLAVTLNIYR